MKFTENCIIDVYTTKETKVIDVLLHIISQPHEVSLIIIFMIRDS